MSDPQPDDLYADATFRKRANWVIVVVAVVTLLVLALPFIAVFTNWL